MAKVKKSTKKFLQKKSSGRKLFHKKPEWKRRGPAEGITYSIIFFNFH